MGPLQTLMGWALMGPPELLGPRLFGGGMGWALMAPPGPQLALDYLEGASWAPVGPHGLGPDGPP